jgi:hypothetical protein
MIRALSFALLMMLLAASYTTVRADENESRSGRRSSMSDETVMRDLYSTDGSGFGMKGNMI